MKSALPFILGLLLLVSCNSEEPKQPTTPQPTVNAPQNVQSLSGQFDYGVVNGSFYENDYFNVQIPVPEGWYALSEEELQMAATRSMDDTLQTDREQGRYVDPVSIKYTDLFMLYKTKPDPSIPQNSGFILAAENIKQAGISSAAEYIDIARNDVVSTRKIILLEARHLNAL